MLGTTLGVATLAPTLARAQAAPASGKQYDIGAGSLDQVLGHFGRQAGVLVAIDPELTKGLRSEGLHGTYTVTEALAALLSGQQLEAVSGPSGAIACASAARRPRRAPKPAAPCWRR
ncbi:STN domain-containing protein [Cupriavidus basilensis]